MENQLKNRELKHKKKQKGLSPFTKLDAGNVEYNVNTFNNSTMSEHIFNNPERYNLINRIRNEFNKNYKFDNYTTQQLFNILKKLEAEKEKSKIDKNNNFRHTLIDDPTFNFDDPDREGDYEVEKINIREALNKLDRDSLEGNYQDLLNLYEAAQPRLTAQDKMELKKIISSTNDPEVVANALQTKVAKESMCEYYFTDEATLDEIARAFGTADFRINPDYIDYSMRPKDYNAKAISEDEIELNYICQEPFAQHSVDLFEEEIEEIFKDICAEANYIYPFDVKVNVKCRDYDYYNNQTFEDDGVKYLYEDNFILHINEREISESFESFEEAMNESTCNYADRYNNIVIYECDGKYIATAINGKSISGKSIDDVKSQLDKIDAEYRKHFNDLEEDTNVDYTYTLDDMADAISFAEADEEDKEVYYIDEANIPHNMRCKSFDTSVENDIVVLEWISMEGFTPEDFEQFKTEVQRVFSELINITNYSEPFEVDIECSTRGYDANRFNPDNVNHQSATIKFNQSSNESLDEAFEQYDMRQGWTPEDIEKHKNIDWKELNYSDYEDTSDQFEYEVVLYDFNNRPERKTVLMSKYYRANSIFPPFYAPANNEKPFENAVGPMFDGDTRGNYDIHNRYETQEVYDKLSEDLNENTNTLDVEAQKVYDILKEYGANSIENTQGIYEIGFSDEINDATLILNQLESNGYEYIADYGNDVYIVDYIDESKKFNIKVVDGDKITVYVSVEESMNEDYQHEDDKWGNPFLVKDIERTLAEITDNFREKDGTVRTGYEEEKIIAKKVLEKHYDIVEVSDGRRYDNDDVTWVISYTSPKNNKNESINMKFKKIINESRANINLEDLKKVAFEVNNMAGFENNDYEYDENSISFDIYLDLSDLKNLIAKYTFIGNKCINDYDYSEDVEFYAGNDIYIYIENAFNKNDGKCIVSNKKRLRTKSLNTLKNQMKKALAIATENFTVEENECLQDELVDLDMSYCNYVFAEEILKQYYDYVDVYCGFMYTESLEVDIEISDLK